MTKIANSRETLDKKINLKDRRTPACRMMHALWRFLDSHKAAMEDAYWRRGENGPIPQCECGPCREARSACDAFIKSIADLNC